MPRSNEPLRRVTTAANQAEAELVEGMLRAEGIRCVIKRSRGADVPDFLAAGWRDLMVPESDVAAARDLLQLPAEQPLSDRPDPLRLGLAILVGVAVITLFVAIGYALS